MWLFRDAGESERRGAGKGSGQITQRLLADGKNLVLHPQSPEKTFLAGNGRLDKIFFGTDHCACDADTGMERGGRWTVRRLLPIVLGKDSSGFTKMLGSRGWTEVDRFNVQGKVP